ncbi:MAG: hypothetical protein AAGF36_16835 [Pseudomonadota bacterium]
MRWVILGIFGLALAGCDFVPQWAGGNRAASAVEAPDVVAPPASEAESGTEADVPADDVVEPLPDDAEISIGTLGRTVASLGNAAEPGLWLKTPLVAVEQPGRVYYPDTNKTVEVTLIPIEGPDTAGSRLSLAAMQALGASLTGLPEVDVFAG